MPDMPDEEVLATCKRMWDETVAGNSDWRDRAIKSFKFYQGDQWDSVVKSVLDAEGRPALTINKVLPKVNLVSGIERQNRVDMAAMPRKGRYRQTGEILTSVCKHARDVAGAEYEESMMFLDGSIGGKGWIRLDIEDTADSIEGDIVLERVSPFSVYEDPLNKHYDVDKGRYVIRTWWWTKEQVELAYPDADLTPGTSDVGGGEGEPDWQQSGEGFAGASPAEARYRVKEVWWKTQERQSHLIGMATGETTVLDGAQEKSRGKAIAAQMPDDYQYKERIVWILHRALIVGDTVLVYERSPFGKFTIFPLVRYCPYWVDGYIMGMVDNIVGPQEELNKRRSQALHHLNQSANSGWMYEEGTLSPDQEVNLREFGAKPGILVKFSRGKTPPARISPMPISQAHLALEALAGNDMKEISGANDDLLGFQPAQHESGVAMEHRRSQGMVILEVMFDNFRRAQQALNFALVELIRRTGVYTPEEIGAIWEGQEIPGHEIPLDSLLVGKYAIKITEAPKSPTLRAWNLERLMELVKMGLPIDPKRLLEASDIPNKEQLIADIEARQASAPGGPGGPSPGGRPAFPVAAG
jgi:hypothetical protein